MQYDVNFWTEPDWRRESTISPLFLMFIVLSVFVLIGLTLTSITLGARANANADLKRLQAARDEIKDEAEQVRKQRKQARSWQAKHDMLQRLADRRIVWSRQLEALQAMVPPRMVFVSLACTADRVMATELGLATGRGAKRDSSGKKEEEQVALRYTLTINGRVRGENAQETVTSFSRQLRGNAVTGSELESRELKNLSGETTKEGTPASTFTIVCKYKPVLITGE